MKIRYYLNWENFMEMLDEHKIKKCKFAKIAWISKQNTYDQEKRADEWKKIWLPNKTYSAYIEWFKKILWDDFDQSIYFDKTTVEYKKIETII